MRMMASIILPLGHFAHFHHFSHKSVAESGFFLIGSVHVFVGVHDFFLKFLFLTRQIVHPFIKEFLLRVEVLFVIYVRKNKIVNKK